MENVGKNLREKNMAKFEDDSSDSPALSTPNLVSGGFDELTTETRKKNASAAFSQDGMYASPFANDHFNSKLLGFDLGPVMNSQYDKNGFLDPLNSHVDFEKLKADNQSAFTKMGSLAAQFVGKTAVGVVGNIVGGIYGLGHAMTEDGDINSLWDNAVYRSLDEANESIEAKNSIFVNNKDNLGFNFKTFKEVNDAFTFIAGAAISEIFMQTAGNVMGGAGILSAPLRFTKYGKKIGQMMKMLDKAEDVEKMAMKLGATVEEMSRLKRISDVSKAITNNARRAVTTTGYEAGLEARGAHDEMKQNLTSELEFEMERMQFASQDEKTEYKRSKLAEIDNAAESAGLMTFGLNTAVLGISNAMQFPQIFGNNFTKNVYTGGLIRKGIGEIGKKEGKRAAVKNAFGTVGRVLKNPATEFMEETLQGLSSNFSQNWFELNMGKRTQAGVLAPYVNNVAESMHTALADTYGTKEGLHEGIIGAIVGTIGIPGMKKGKKGRKLTVHGGIAESIRDEITRRKDIESAITSINSSKMSDVLSYNKDNAILSALDPQKEDFALMTNNKVEFESVKDNKVFRYTQDRLEKGMEDFIQDDISEMREMADTNLEKYKKTFGKDEGFTKEEATEEIDAFENKVKIYKDAYKTVHRRFNLNLMRGDNVTKKLTDTLTYAVATEQVYGARLDKIKQSLFEKLNGDFTKEEIEQFVTTSGKVGKVKSFLDEYIKNKENKLAKNKNAGFKKQAKLKERMNPETAYLLDMSKESLQEELEMLQDAPLEERAVLEAEINKALNLKDNYDAAVADKKFSANKSSKVRDIRDDIAELTDEINKQVEKETSRSMKAISRPAEKLTRKELGDYLKQKSNIIKKLNDDFNSKGVFTLSQEDHETAEDFVQEMHEVTDRYMTSVNVAAYLYGFKNNPSKAYQKVLASQFYADFDNATRMSEYLDILMEDEPSDEFRTLFDEFKDVIASMEEEITEISDAFDKKDVDELKREFKRLKSKIKRYNRFLKIKEDLTDQRGKSTKTATGKVGDDGLKPGELDFGDTVDDGDDSDDSTGTDGDTKNPKGSSSSRYNHANRLSIREGGAFVSKNKDDFKKKLNDGELKNKAATTLTLVKSSLDPANDPDLKAYLEKEGVLESYMEGLKKIDDNADLLKKQKARDLDPDVYTFIRYAPVQMDIYDKVLSPDNDYEYEIDDSDKPVFTQDRFFKADDVLKEDENALVLEAEYHDRLEEIDAAEKEALDKNSAEKTDTSTRIKSMYNKQRTDAYERYRSSGNNSHSNFSFRHQLIHNEFVNGTNQVKLKIHKVDQGEFEVFNFEQKIIREENPETLGYKVEDMTIDDVYYGTSQGIFRNINGDNTTTMDGFHPFKNMKGEGINGKLFFKYKNVSGKEVPVRMNTAKLDEKHITIISNVLRDYFKTVDKSEFKVRKSGIEFLDDKELPLNEFLEFFMRQKGGPSNHVIFLNNTFNVKPIKDAPGEYEVLFFTGDVESMVIRSEKDLDAMSDIFIDELSKARFTINKSAIVTDGVLDKTAMQYYFDNGIINHTFDVDNNYDKIYSKKKQAEDGTEQDYNKGIVLSNHNTPDTPSTFEKPESFDLMIKNLRLKLANTTDKSKYEPNLRTINSSMINGILNSVKKQSDSADLSGLSDKELDEKLLEMLNKAVDNITNSRLKSIQQVIDKRPNKFDPKGNHDTDFKIKDTDTEVDKFLRVIYAFKKEVYKNKTFISEAKKEARTWGSKSKLLKSFENVPRQLSINKYSDRKKNEIASQFSTKEQFDNMMDMVYLIQDLSKLEKEEGKGYMHITYSEDYVANVNSKTKVPNGPTTYKMLDQNNLTADNKVKGHYKTRLTSVEIDGAPRWENGKIVGGSVYLNVRDWNRTDRKQGGDKLILFQDSEEKARKHNLVTSIGMPFMNSDFAIKDKELTQLIKDTDARKKARERNVKKIIIDTQKLIGRKDIDLVSLNSVTADQIALYSADDVDDMFEESGALDKDKDKPGTNMPKPPKDPPTDVNLDIYTKEDGDYFGIIMDIFEDDVSFWKAKSMNEDLRQDAKKALTDMGITSPDKLLLIYNRYKSLGIVEDIKEMDKFAEYVFGVTIDNNCN